MAADIPASLITGFAAVADRLSQAPDVSAILDPRAWPKPAPS
jgi:hypothetical protein